MNFSEIKHKPRRTSYKKPEAVKELERIADAFARRKYPNTPDYAFAHRKFRDDSANGLTACITAYLRIKGAFVSRLNNTGIYDKRLMRYRPGTSRKGLPDVVCTYKSKSIFIEIKHAADRLSEFQKKVRDEQTRSGGLWFTARNFTETKEWIDNLN